MASCSRSESADIEKTTNEIISIEKQALDRWGRGDVFGYIDIADSAITYFDPGLEKRCDGITAFRTLLEPFQGKIRIFRYELIDPKVQVQGDIAVLTYNLLDYEKSGSKIGRWNTTEVYRKSRGAWRLFSSHFSYTKKDAE